MNPSVPAGPKRLTRSKDDRKLLGVCGGIAQYFGLDPTLVRVLWVVLSIVPGTIIGGIIVYLLVFLVVPEEPSAPGALAYAAPPPPPPAPPPSS